jgi:hypothetical protein
LIKPRGHAWNVSSNGKCTVTTPREWVTIATPKRSARVTVTMEPAFDDPTIFLEREVVIVVAAAAVVAVWKGVSLANLEVVDVTPSAVQARYFVAEVLMIPEACPAAANTI